MSKQKVMRLWICNRQNGATTVGRYVNGKRRVFFTVRHNNADDYQELLDLLKTVAATLPPLHGYELAGDPWPVLHSDLARLGLLVNEGEQ